MKQVLMAILLSAALAVPLLAQEQKGMTMKEGMPMQGEGMMMGKMKDMQGRMGEMRKGMGGMMKGQGMMKSEDMKGMGGMMGNMSGMMGDMGQMMGSGKMTPEEMQNMSGSGRPFPKARISKLLVIPTSRVRGYRRRPKQMGKARASTRPGFTTALPIWADTHQPSSVSYIGDVKDPWKMQVLSFIPCNAGTRCNYIGVNPSRKILVGTQDINSANPNQPPAGQPVQAG